MRICGLWRNYVTKQASLRNFSTGPCATITRRHADKKKIDDTDNDDMRNQQRLAEIRFDDLMASTLFKEGGYPPILVYWSISTLNQGAPVRCKIWYHVVNCLYACMHACMHACTLACMHACVHACMRFSGIFNLFNI